MPRVKIIKIVFDTFLKDWEIPAFRGAIISKVGREEVLFHNHLSDAKFVYKYPLIQYKLDGANACIVCVEAGTEEIHRLFTRNSGQIKIGNRIKPLRVKNIEINNFQVKLSDQTFSYGIENWLGLNELNLKKYNDLDSLTDKVSFLERILTGNILSFAKGIEWTISEPIRLQITDIPSQHLIVHKGVKFLAFSFNFKSNIAIPYSIGLGKGASVGRGILSKSK